MDEEPEEPAVKIEDSVINRSRINSPTILNLGPTINIGGQAGGEAARQDSQTPKEINLSATSGDINCNVGGPGRIRTTSGDIRVSLTAPLEVIVRTNSGDVHVDDSLELGGSGYVPRSGERPIGTLRLETTSGDVYVTYAR